ncbi:MAG: LAGLIDADG family homing endonuclease [Candidatus Micrarchaeota archaeon]
MLNEIETTSDEFLEFFGVLMGDGCIVRFKKPNNRYYFRIFISGNATRDLEYLTQFINPILKRFGVHAYFYKDKHTNTINAVINNKKFAELLTSLDFPVGKKGQIEIPKWIMKLPLEKRFNVIRGLFDTDGSMSARKSEQYRRPLVLISSESTPLRKQLKIMLREVGLPAYDSSGDVGISGIACTKKWFELIGSNNPRNLDRYNGWIKTGTLPMLDIKK